AEQNMRRFYELDTFGKTRLPLALIDRVTLTAIRNSLAAEGADAHRLIHLDAMKGISPFIAPEATMPRVKPRRDWRGFGWAIGTVLLATAVGWPLVHSRLHLANVNILML